MSIIHRIWQHLIEITRQNDVTAILTTHYIEEARQANTVKLNMNFL
jgi:ABC-type multidrug transport system ATPase subunit